MKKKLQEKKLAETLYMNTAMSQKEISEYVGVSENTLAKWASEGKWELRKSAVSVSVDSLITKTLDKISKLLDEDNVNADKIMKLAKYVREIGKTETTIVNYVEAFSEFVRYVSKKDVPLAKRINELQNEFVQTKIG